MIFPNLNLVKQASQDIRPYIHRTPLVYSSELNKLFNCQIFFKMDALQKTGAFKIRGVLNHLLTLKKQGNLPKKIVTYSTGNHGLALAYASKIFNFQARIYLPKNVARIKKQLAQNYGAQIIETSTRELAEQTAYQDSIQYGYYYLHPSAAESTILGASTMCYEALFDLQKQHIKIDAIFGPCGGGGLLAGSLLAKNLLSPRSLLIGAEPEIANDAYLSRQQERIFRFTDSPNTVADGLRALSISPTTFPYLQALDDLYLIDEATIKYWSAWLIQLTKITCEPSAAIAMAAANKWLQGKRNKNIVVLITGGNLDTEFYQQLSYTNLLLPIR